MNTDFMKKVDFWIGIPLCFLFSMINSMIHLFSPQQPRPIRRILLIKPSEMGALILAYPLIRRLKQAFPNVELFFLTFEKNKSVLSLLPNIARPENILTLRDGSLGKFIFDNLKVLRELKSLNVDACVDLEFFSRYTAIVAFLSGAWMRAGFHGYNYEGLYRGNLLTHRIQYNPLMHTAKSFLALGESLISSNQKVTPEMNRIFREGDFIIPQYPSKGETREQAITKLKKQGWREGKKIVLINPGDGILKLREWSLENFVSVGEKLLSLEKYQIVLVGVESELKKDEALTRSLGERNCINLTGKTTLEELMELFFLSEALISNDSGLAHLASLTPIAKFILFGPESPNVFAPINGKMNVFYAGIPCSPCLSAFNHRNSSCKDNQCLKAISPQQVFSQVKEYLESEKTSFPQNIFNL
jgi:lipopolysaccharide heptosyltransferase II